MKMPKGLLAASVAVVGIAMVAPSAFAAGTTPTSTTTQTTSQQVGVPEKVATDLGLSVTVVRQSLSNAGLNGLADAAHETVPAVNHTLRSDHLLRGVGMFLVRHRRVEHGVQVGLAAVAKEMNLKPHEMLREAQQHRLQLPSGTTAQSLEATADSAVQGWIATLAQKHPKLTTTMQGNLTKTVDAALARILTKIAG